MTGEVTPRVSPNTIPQNGYVGRGQSQPGAGDSAIQAASQSVNKGGMRGAGLIAVTIGEVMLKKKATDLAKDYYRVNKKDYDNFRRIHEDPMRASVREAMSRATNPTYRHDFYASAPAGMAKTAVLDKQWFETRRRAPRYAVGLQQKIDADFAIQRMHGIIAGWNIGRRYEITYADEHNNRRFDKMLEVGNVGIGVGNVVRRGLASSVQNLASAYDNVGDTIATIGNGLSANSGYQSGRRDAARRYEQRNAE